MCLVGTASFMPANQSKVEVNMYVCVCGISFQSIVGVNPVELDV